LIERVYDESRIKPIVLSMIDDIIEDGTSHECFELDVRRDCWLSCDDYKALFYIKAFNRTTLDLHCYIPRENRNKSIDYGFMAIEWIKKNSPDMYKKVITQVPSIYRHIGIYVKKLGFVKEGCYTRSFMKNGELWDLNLFGLKRCDI
jgi:hypothetical protein